MKTHAAFLAILASSILHPAARADDLETGFRSPPHSACIRCFWWWLNSNVTRDAITRDFVEMKAKGFSGALIFDADGSAQQGNTRTQAGPAFGLRKWTELSVHACREAKRLDLELSFNIPTWKETSSVSGPWQVTFDPKLGGPTNPVTFPALIDWLDHPDAAVSNYSGKAAYRGTFILTHDQDRQALAIELGEVRGVGIARVKLNGTDLGVTWRPPYRVALGAAAKTGTNTLEVTVINSWRNRVMADEKPTVPERVARTNIRVRHQSRFQWRLEPSGLLGPVRLVAPAE